MRRWWSGGSTALLRAASVLSTGTIIQEGIASANIVFTTVVPLGYLKCPHCHKHAISRLEGAVTNWWTSTPCPACGRRSTVSLLVNLWNSLVFAPLFLIGVTVAAIRFESWPGRFALAAFALLLVLLLSLPALVLPLRPSFPERRENWLRTLRRFFRQRMG